MDHVRISNIAGLVGFILWAFFERAFSLGGQQQEAGEKKEKGTYWLVTLGWYGAVVYSLLDAWSFDFSLFNSPLIILQVTGILLVASGLILRFIARKALGQHYSVHVQTSGGHQLVTAGIYSSIRHPAYLGLLCLMIGIPLCAGSWGGLAIVALLGTPAVINRTLIEEKALSEWFGGTYMIYKENSWRLIPHIW